MFSKASKSDQPAVAGKRAVFLADVVGCVALYKSEGDAIAESLIREALDSISARFASHGGVEIKRQGDSILGVLPSAHAAAAVARDTQVHARQGRLRFRIALDFGDVVLRDGDVFGTTVNTAFRLNAKARAEQILLTTQVSEGLTAWPSDMVRTYDEVDIKGLGRTRIMQLIWDPHGATEQREFSDEDDTVKFSIELTFGSVQKTLAASELPVTIGRDPSCCIIVDTRLVSKRHVHLSFARGKFLITDESLNGTFLELVVPGRKPKIVYARNEGIVITDKAGRIFLGSEPTNKGPSVSFRILETSTGGAIGQ